MAARKGLGKGLDTLIPKGVVVNDKPSSAENVKAAKPDMVVKITKVEPNRNQPRKKFDEDSLQELSDSIKIHGVLFPILVVDRGDYYEIVAGERRWRAAKMAGLKEVPVIIRDYTEKEIAEISRDPTLTREKQRTHTRALSTSIIINRMNLQREYQRAGQRSPMP